MGFSGSLVEAIVLRCFSLFTLQAQDRVNEQRAMEKSGNTSQVTRSLYAGSLNPPIGQWRSGSYSVRVAAIWSSSLFP